MQDFLLGISDDDGPSRLLQDKPVDVVDGRLSPRLFGAPWFDQKFQPAGSRQKEAPEEYFLFPGFVDCFASAKMSNEVLKILTHLCEGWFTDTRRFMISDKHIDTRRKFPCALKGGHGDVQMHESQEDTVKVTAPVYLMCEEEFVIHDQMAKKRKSVEESILASLSQCFSCLECGDSL